MKWNDENMKRAIIHGCYHTANFGDLLLVDLVSDHLRDTYGIDTVSPWIAPSVAEQVHVDAGRGLRDCFGGCAAILGGGGYLHSGSDHRAQRRLLRYFVPAKIWQLTRTPYVIVGTGAGPKIEGKGLTRIRQLCTGARAVCVRDEESKQALVQAGIPGSEVQVTADLVLGMTKDQIPIEDVEAARAALGPRREGVRRFGIHLQLGARHASILQRLIEGIAGDLRGRDDIEPVFIFDHGSKQLDAIKDLCREHLPNAKVIPSLPHWSTAALLAEIDGLLTHKLHTGITAWTFGVPVCGYSINHGKTSRFYRQIGRSDFQAELGTDNDRVIGWVKCFADDPDAFRVESQEAREALPKLARRNYEVIDEHLGDVLRANAV